MLSSRLADMSAAVALRKESVDRNGSWTAPSPPLRRVALRKESVDRNLNFFRLQRSIDVALRKESVDRNVRPPAGPHVAHKSLSARRAWIEIMSLNTQQRHNPSRSPQGERG